MWLRMPTKRISQGSSSLICKQKCLWDGDLHVGQLAAKAATDITSRDFVPSGNFKTPLSSCCFLLYSFP